VRGGGGLREIRRGLLDAAMEEVEKCRIGVEDCTLRERGEGGAPIPTGEASAAETEARVDA
jgi:hypothetical protein